MGKLVGTIAITGLPPHRGLMVSLCFYRVDSADTPAPYGGDPPTEAATDCQQIAKQVDLNTEVTATVYELPFEVERPVGFYYLQVRAILFRFEGSKMLAQVEPYFYARRPVAIADEPLGHITLPVPWPGVPANELHHAGTIKPRSKGKA
jgi:hypothetical protein